MNVLVIFSLVGLFPLELQPFICQSGLAAQACARPLRAAAVERVGTFDRHWKGMRSVMTRQLVGISLRTRPLQQALMPRMK